jgi:hypothetical protein
MSGTAVRPRIAEQPSIPSSLRVPTAVVLHHLNGPLRGVTDRAYAPDVCGAIQRFTTFPLCWEPVAAKAFAVAGVDTELISHWPSQAAWNREPTGTPMQEDAGYTSAESSMPSSTRSEFEVGGWLLDQLWISGANLYPVRTQVECVCTVMSDQYLQALDRLSGAGPEALADLGQVHPVRQFDLPFDWTAGQTGLSGLDMLGVAGGTFERLLLGRPYLCALTSGYGLDRDPLVVEDGDLDGNEQLSLPLTGAGQGSERSE